MTEAAAGSEQVQLQWEDWVAQAREEGLPVPDDARVLTSVPAVWAASDYLVQSCQREPALLSDLVESGRLAAAYVPGECQRQLDDWLRDVADEARLMQLLRRFRRYQMVRIVWRDLAGWAGLGETLEDLSALADACVRRSLDWLYARCLEELGVPRDAEGRQQHLLVLGMGKLGARELNLSSDIDLIFAFPASGEVDGGRRLGNQQFFVQLCRKLVQVLNAPTADGFVFRVDTRLRPFGEAGPLAMSFGAMEDYYQSHAREWERYAMIKARVVVGQKADAERLMTLLRPFVYRRYLDFGAIESLRDMKQLIERELKRKGMAENIKLGPGGIREIEFIGQAFQLIRGGRDPDLQRRAILPVLRLLAEKALLPDYMVTELSTAYVFLRRVENRLQAWRDRQTHRLPEDPEGRARLAGSMGFADWNGFAGELGHHRRRVQGYFDQVFATPQTVHPEERPLAALWRETLDPAQAMEVLAAAGFRAPAAALERIDGFRASATVRHLSARGRERLEQLMPLLLERLRESHDPDLTLDRLLGLLESIARRTAYLALLVEHPVALSQLVRLTGIGPWIARQLARQPLLLDELLDPRRLYAPLQRPGLEKELAALLTPLAGDDLEQRMERLRQFAQSNMLRVAAADLTGVIPLMVVSDYLTEIAEVVLASVLEQAWNDLTRRHGRPGNVFGSDSGFAVIGYGKLGGVELGYGSDLDLVFLHGSLGSGAMTGGERPLANEVFYARLGQRIIHMLHTRTPSGILYEVDMRLRPNGASGMLVSSLNAFATYQRENAWTWEHQALLRARPIAGDQAVQERFRAIRREVLCREREAESLRGDVREMREKMRAQLDKSGSGRFDLKQGHGGIADIEFMVQYHVLRWAHRYPDLVEWSDNMRLLEGLSRHRLLAGDAAQALADAYRRLRDASHRNSLQEQPGLVPDERLLDVRTRVESLWRSLMEG